MKVNKTEIQQALGVCKMTVYNKMNGRTQWKLDELQTLYDKFGLVWNTEKKQFEKH